MISAAIPRMVGKEWFKKLVPEIGNWAKLL
jgi:hypothetical protein